jgi:tetratricopeptide (TPR) repeat protein
VAEAALFDAQEEIAATVANTLVPRLNEAELRASRRRPPEDLGAYHLLLQARELMSRLGPETFAEAGTLLQQAIALDPGYAASHAALADWHSLRIFQGWSPDREADVRALEAAVRTALRLDPGHARALALFGHNRTIAGRHYEEAMTLFERALNAVPNDAETWMWTAPTFAYVGRAEEAIQRAERAIALSPQDPFMFRQEHFLGIAHYAAGHHEEAVHWGRRSELGNPNYTSNLRITAAALVALGHPGEAEPLVRRVMALEPGFRAAAFIRTQAFRDDAQRALYGQRLVEAGFPP